MAKTVFAAIFYLLFLCANSARILDEVVPQDPFVVGPPAATSTLPSPVATFPSGQFPAIPTVDEADSPVVSATVAAPDDDVEAPETDVAPVVPPVTVGSPIPVPTPIATSPSGPSSTVPTTATVANPTGPQTPIATSPSVATNPTGPQTTGAATSAPILSFFMHDILGGSQPSVRVVTGIIARTDINGIPFSVPNNNFFPLQGGTPVPNLNNINNLINPTTAPLITGLNPGQANTVLQNSANNNNVVNGNNQPFVTAGQLPAGSIQKLMFGSITVIDDELTEEHELGSPVIGKAQGFYLASSLDGTSHTMAFTVIMHGGDNNNHHGNVIEDTISFFGVHRTASHESQIAVIGGTGKYENAKGYSVVETIPDVNQHTTDGVDTVMHFTVYLSE
ncbi:dirigent protein 24-like [Mercurialis annua]|uniref:dirigent protein 24-like n=1 Tax=Mercurialis annua TaxID=3986 RepID=UPI00215E7AEB|nr:dirigent protein 24-like [Mercurialis annua]